MKKMKKDGPNEVVNNLQKLNELAGKKMKNLPSALKNFDGILEKIKKYKLVLCLDYDGTLSPIVEDYNKAFLSAAMRKQIKALADKIPVAIVSGRDIRFIVEMVNLPGIFYAGSHGFEIKGPNGFYHELDEAQALLPVLKQVEEKLTAELSSIEGVKVERKKYAIAVHYRNTAEENIAQVENTVNRLLADYHKLKKGTGKKVLELKPHIDWDKGKAVELICKQLSEATKAAAAIYIGDDVTDEDAFKIIDKGVGIMVGHHHEPTAATYFLEDVDEVHAFLKKLSQSW